MNFILKNWKDMLPIVISVFSILVALYNNWYSGKLKKDIQKLNRQQERQLKLSEGQKAVLFIVQNMLGDRIKVKNTLDIVSKMEKIMKHNDYKKIFNLELFQNPVAAFSSAVALNTCSEKVMAISLRIQEGSYEKSDQYSSMILYSLLYKYLYLEFTENEIDDLYLLRFNLNDFNSSIKQLEQIKDEIYLNLRNKHDWGKLKN